MNKLLITTNTQKILDFLIRHPGSLFQAGEVQKAVKLSKGGTNLSLRELAKQKLIKRQKRGNFFFYSVDHTQPIIKQLKVLKNIENINSLINTLKKFSQKIILFGSGARGENTPESDIDIFILSNQSSEVETILKKHRESSKFQFIIRAPTSFAVMEKREPVFFGEIQRGITLWEVME